MKDISTIEDIKLLVDNFYQKVRETEMLSPSLTGSFKTAGPQQLEKMCRFWQTVLLQEHTYFGSPF